MLEKDNTKVYPSNFLGNNIPTGWYVRIEVEKKKKAEREAMSNLAKILGQSSILGRKL